MIIGNGQRGVKRIGPNQGDTARTSVGMRSSLDKRFLVIYPEDSLYHSQLQQSRVSLCMCHRYISSSTPFSRRRSPMRATWMAGRAAECTRHRLNCGDVLSAHRVGLANCMSSSLFVIEPQRRRMVVAF